MRLGSVWLLLQQGDEVQRAPVCVPVVGGGQLPLREGELILMCFYLLFSNFCPPPPLPEKEIF